MQIWAIQSANENQKTSNFHCTMELLGSPSYYKKNMDFRTPKSIPQTPSGIFKTPGATHYYTPAREMSDSEESTGSTNGHGNSSGNSSNGDLTLVAEFDEIVRHYKQRGSDDVEDELLNANELLEMAVEKALLFQNECKRLREEMDGKIHQLTDLESKLSLARRLVDQEKRRSRMVEDERDALKDQVLRVQQFLFRDGNFRMPEETKDKLSYLNKVTGLNWDPNANGAQPPLTVIQEGNTTGSLLTDLSYSRSEDDSVMDLPAENKWKKHRPSNEFAAEPAMKKRRSSHNKVVEIANTDSVRATTTVTVPKCGPITATSIIEAIPADANERNVNNEEVEELRRREPSAPPMEPQFNYPLKSPMTPKSHLMPVYQRPSMRQHCFQQKTIVMPDLCAPCQKRIRFGKTALKCKDCRATCHPDCKNNLPLPCVPYVNTPPMQRAQMGFISDYTPTTAPMVPALIVHCLNEIESRGLTEIGVYRIPGSERDVKQLKERFLKGKGSPCLNQIDIHVICGVVKDFLKSLQEPLVTYNLWRRFVKCVEAQEDQGALYSIISELPQPNRDSLAYMMVHLKKVGEAKDCKMPLSNLSKVFGPTIVGYSCAEPKNENLIQETRQQNMVVEALLNLPGTYWESFVNTSNNLRPPVLQQTPSTDSLLRPNSHFTITPLNARRRLRKGKVFLTPPNLR